MEAVDRWAVHEHELQQSSIKFAASRFGTPREKVEHVGQSRDMGPIRHICHHNSSLVLPLEENDGPTRFNDRRNIVEIRPTFELIDNTLFQKHIILAGQCQECGQVYIANYLAT